MEQQRKKQLQQPHATIMKADADDGDEEGPIENPETALQKLKGVSFDLTLNINCEQKTTGGCGTTTPMIYYCCYGRLPMIRFLKLHGASCTNRDSDGWFPMYAAARNGQKENCEWLYKYGGDAKYDVNQEYDYGFTPLSASILNGHISQAQWFILHGGGQDLSERAVNKLRYGCSNYERGQTIMTWKRASIVFHDTTFFLFLCGGASAYMHSTSENRNITAPTASSSSSSSSILPHSNLPLLNGQPGVMELIGHYAGLIYGTELRRLKELILLVE